MSTGVSVLWHKTLYRDAHFYAAFPSLAVLPDGEIMLAFRRAPDHRWMYGPPQKEDFHAVDHVHFRSHVAAMRLDGEGAVLTDPAILPVHAEAGDQDANLYVTNSGRIIQYGFLWYPVPAASVRRLTELERKFHIQPEDGEGFLYWGSYSRYSDDGGHSWSDRFMMPTDDLGYAPLFGRDPAGAVLRGRMVALADGMLAVAGYSGGLKGYDHAAVRLFTSRDNGESWQVSRTLVGMKDAALQEPALAKWPDDSLTVFCRTGGLDDRLVTARSSDGGATFEPPQAVDMMGHPHDPLVLPDGRLFLVYGYRHHPMGVRARLVAKGQRIEDAEEVVIRDDSPSRDTGYPSAVQLPDGRILIAYYISDEQGIRGIDGTLVCLN